MFKNNESYQLVKDICIKSIPKIIAHKIRKEDDILLVTNNKGSLFFLNSVSKDFLILCDGIRSVSEIADEILNLYEIDFNTLIDDLIELIRDLQLKRIIRIDLIYDDIR